MTPNVRLGRPVLVWLGAVITVLALYYIAETMTFTLFLCSIPLDLGTHISASPRGTLDEVVEVVLV